MTTKRKAWRDRFIAGGVALTIMVGAAAGFAIAKDFYGIYLRKKPIYPADGRPLTKLPSETESWIQVGADRRESAEVEKTLGTTNYVSRRYKEKNPADPANPAFIDLHCAYYTGQIDTVPHVPDRCFIGGGMAIGSAAQVLPLDLRRDDWVIQTDVPEHLKGKIYRARLSNTYSDRPGRHVNLPKGAERIDMRILEFLGPSDGRNPPARLYSGYFFIANGATVATAEGVRLLSFDLTSDYAFYLKVQTTSYQATSHEDLAKKSSALLRELLPEIVRCAPDWVEVELGNEPPDNPRRVRAAGTEGSGDGKSEGDAKATQTTPARTG
ncbi:MAG: exosortase-associated EpsI family protein [Planctomycetota bacterium]|nr:exosortase-associated EpsI family protein [Planctomycetota bacterium]